MLKIVIPKTDLWDEKEERFITVKSHTLQLEHSLVSLAKWESKWHKPFLRYDDKTTEETIDYIRCMTLTQNVDPNVYLCVTDENVEQIRKYIDDDMTATWFSDSEKKGKSREIITAEIIYYWMIALNIPFECQKWHLNRLLTLIRVCNEKNNPPKKKSRKQLLREYAEINAERRKRFNTKG